jgi:hypothetical protein
LLVFKDNFPAAWAAGLWTPHKIQIAILSCFIRPYKINLDIKTIFQFAVSGDGVEQDFSPAVRL